MRFSEYVAMARAHWVGLTAFGAVGVLLAGLLCLTATPMYTAKAELVVVADTGNANDLAQGSDYTAKQVRTFSALATRPLVLTPAAKKLGIDVDSDALAHSLSVSNILNTNVISISATRPSPRGAADLANAVAASLTTAVSGIVPELPSGEKSVRLETIRPAAVPGVPSSPKVRLWLFLGAFGGLLLGALAIALRSALDTKVRDVESADVAGAPVLGTISLERGARRTVVATSSERGSRRVEEYRQIRTSISFLTVGGDRHQFAITSSRPGEGKSTTAANLASLLAVAGHRVCLLEADLRRPSLGRLLGLEGSVGLTTVLVGRATVPEVVQPFGPDGLHVLLAGRRPPNPSELLASPQMADVLAQLRSSYDYTIIDCPPLLPVTDAAVVGHQVGGVILVVAVGVVRRDEVRRARSTLGAAETPLIGVIGNLTRGATPKAYWDTYAVDQVDEEPPVDDGAATAHRYQHEEPHASATTEDHPTAGTVESGAETEPSDTLAETDDAPEAPAHTPDRQRQRLTVVDPPSPRFHDLETETYPDDVADDGERRPVPLLPARRDA